MKASADLAEQVLIEGGLELTNGAISGALSSCIGGWESFNESQQELTREKVKRESTRVMADVFAEKFDTQELIHLLSFYMSPLGHKVRETLSVLQATDILGRVVARLGDQGKLIPT